MKISRSPIPRQEWRKILTPEQYAIMREHGTERAGSCALNYEKRAGTFFCAGCNSPLFTAQTKFESGTGWPSFNDPVPGAVETTVDRSYGMTRTEVHCARCGSHLGHVFDDGPPPTRLRYCINGVAMNFKAGLSVASGMAEFAAKDLAMNAPVSPESFRNGLSAGQPSVSARRAALASCSSISGTPEGDRLLVDAPLSQGIPVRPAGRRDKPR